LFAVGVGTFLVVAFLAIALAVAELLLALFILPLAVARAISLGVEAAGGEAEKRGQKSQESDGFQGRVVA
jgi:hypothetical protein